MRFALLVLSVALVASGSSAQELSKEQLEPWSTLKRQVGLYFQRDWKEHDKYIHPKIVDWGDSMPSPIHFGDEAKEITLSRLRLVLTRWSPFTWCLLALLLRGMSRSSTHIFTC